MTGESAENPSAPSKASDSRAPGPSASRTSFGIRPSGTSRRLPVAEVESATVNSSFGNGSAHDRTASSEHAGPAPCAALGGRLGVRDVCHLSTRAGKQCQRGAATPQLTQREDASRNEVLLPWNSPTSFALPTSRFNIRTTRGALPKLRTPTGRFAHPGADAGVTQRPAVSPRVEGAARPAPGGGGAGSARAALEVAGPAPRWVQEVAGPAPRWVQAAGPQRLRAAAVVRWRPGVEALRLLRGALLPCRARAAAPRPIEGSGSTGARLPGWRSRNARVAPRRRASSDQSPRGTR